MMLLGFILGYLLGTIPFGIVLTRIAGTNDLRSIGSGNIGATNVLRTGRKDLAALTVLGDGLKATLAVFLASYWGQDAAMAAGLGALIGHCFPIWLRFKGGKGTATYLGVLLAFSWPLLVLAGLVWLATAYFFRISSLAALVMTGIIPVAFLLLGDYSLAGLFALMSVLLWLRHRSNIERLMLGKESRIGDA